MSNIAIPQIDWMMIAPISIVCVVGIITLLMEALWPRKVTGAQWFVSLIGLAIAGYMLVGQFDLDEGSTLNGLMVRDTFSIAMQFLILGAAFLCVLFSEEYLDQKKIRFGEFYPLVLWSSVGAMVMTTTHNLLVIFVGLEILSIALYVLAGMSRSEEKSEESAMKYFLLGAFASAFLLYGISFIYGATGSLNLVDLAHPGIKIVNAAWAASDPSTHALLIFGGALIVVGLGFKSSLVPFHQWTPDVYQGAPTNVAAFMASVSKIAALGTLWRFLVDTNALTDFYLPILITLAILTMTIGNLVAIVQKDVKRILGYSSISHAGYVLVAITASLKSPAHDPSTVIYYLGAYTLMTVGSFAVVALAAKDGRESTRLEDLYGLSKRSPLVAAFLVVFMVSLIGMPPTAGFIGKWMIFNDALNANLALLAIVLAANSAISVYYYLGIVRAAYVVEEGQAELSRPKIGVQAAALLCFVGVIAATVFVSRVMVFIH